MRLTLEAFNNQSFSKHNFEIIVVDDGSQDNTYQKLKRLNFDFKLKIIRIEKNKGRSYSRNKGILASEGKLLIFNDCDMIPGPDFIQNHAESHIDGKKVVVGPIWYRIFTFYYEKFNKYYRDTYKGLADGYHHTPSSINKSKNGFRQLIAIGDIRNGNFLKAVYKADWGKWYEEFVNDYGLSLNNFHFPWVLLSSGNMSVLKNNVLKVGNFDENFKGWGGEDWDLGYRLHKQGFQICYNPHCLSFHQEHPHSESERSISSNKNLKYMLRKYCDFELIAYHRCSHLGKKILNEAVDEYYKLKKNVKYHRITVCIDGLVRIHAKKDSFVKKVPQNQLRIMEEIQEVIKEVNKIFNCESSLAKVLSNLL